MRRLPVATLAFSHLAADLNQGALPALLPLLISQRHLSYSVAAGLVMSMSTVSSFLQPAFGWAADHRPISWLAPLGLLVSGISMAVTGILGSYFGLIVAVGLSGLGLAAFHPEGARLVHQYSGRRRGVGMSWFSVGGNLGFAIGPVLTTAALLWLGFRGVCLLAAPAILIATALSWQIWRMSRELPRGEARTLGKAEPAARVDQWRPFSLLAASVVCRSLTFFGLNTFLPLYWIHVFGTSKELGSTALSTFLFSGAVGTLIGGRLGDRFQRNRIVAISFALCLPFFFALLLVRHPALALITLVPMGVALYAPFSVMVVLGQEYLPNRVGTAAGVTIGLAGTVGGLGTPLFGALADHHGLPATLRALFALACVAVALTFLLPKPGTEEGLVRDEQIEVEI
jgi:MFS transporter, FSR family, fosmidomycin resistance protein